MIYIYVGKPRNGKSLRAMMRILWTLENTQRFIVTNMVIDLDEVQEWADKRGLRINVRRRFRFLVEKEEMKNFWLYRDGIDLEKPADYYEKNGRLDVDYACLFQGQRFWVDVSSATPTLKGTLYVIDEIHTLFPARGWQGTPRHADFYNSQHGKLNDECIFITQNTKLVDPNFYRLAQEFHYCRNHRLMKHGRFRGANKFTAHIYDGPANDSTQTTLNIEEFALDLEVARCYDTSAGVGMPGGGTADAAARTKGIPLWSIWVAVGVAIIAVYWIFNYIIPQASNKYLTRAVKGEKLLGESQGEGVASETAPIPSDRLPDRPTERSIQASLSTGLLEPFYLDERPEKPLSVTGYVIGRGRVNIQLSDGRVLTERDTELRRVEGDVQTRLERNALHFRTGQRLFIMAGRTLQNPEVKPTEEHQPVAVVDSGPHLPPPPAKEPSSWQLHSDGVQRLTPAAAAGLRSLAITK